MSPEALRRRMAHGNIYPAERVDAALANYFRPGNLGALRELALLWVADRVEESLQGYLDDHGITDAVGDPGAGSGRHRAARPTVSASSAGPPAWPGGCRASCWASMSWRPTAWPTRLRRALDHQRAAARAARRGLPRGGGRRRGRGPGVVRHRASGPRSSCSAPAAAAALKELLRGSPVTSVLRRLGSVDVHVIASEADEAGGGSRALPAVRRVSSLPRRRKLAGWALAIILLPLLTVVLAAFRDDLLLSTILVLYLAAVVLIAAVGGLVVGLAAAVAAFLLGNWYFTPPIHQWTVAEGENLVALDGVRRRVGPCQLPRRTGAAALPGGVAGPGRGRGAGPHHRVPDRRGRPAPDAGRAAAQQLRPGRRRPCSSARRRAGWTLASSGPAAPPAPGPGMSIDLDDAGRPAPGPDRRPARFGRPAGAAGLRRPAHPGAGEQGAPRGGARSRGPGRDRCLAALAAPGRLPRPPHAAGLDQGRRHQPAAARRDLVARRPRRPA